VTFTIDMNGVKLLEFSSDRYLLRTMKRKTINYRKPKPEPVVTKPFSYVSTRVPHESDADDAVMRFFYEPHKVFWRQLGLAFVAEKISKKEPRPQPTLFIWLSSTHNRILRCSQFTVQG
jgi:hypothetical protein